VKKIQEVVEVKRRHQQMERRKMKTKAVKTTKMKKKVEEEIQKLESLHVMKHQRNANVIMEVHLH